MNDEDIKKHAEQYLKKFENNSIEHKRNVYRKGEIAIFKAMSFKYLNVKSKRKSMGELCLYLGITRKTLSKYKQRNNCWRECINKIKTEIKRYNNIMISKEMTERLWIRIEKMHDEQKEREAKKQSLEYSDDFLKNI